jgi:putative hydrolase of the HAD superfamily
MVRAILFDLGDTLIDFEPMDTRAVFKSAAAGTYRYLADRGHALPTFQAYCRRQFRAVRWAYFWAKFRRREFNSLHLLRSFCAGIGIELDETAAMDLAWLWYAPLIEHSSSEDDLYATLAGLRRAGYKLAVVSNTFVAGPVHDRHLELYALLEFFPVRVYSSDTGYRKPDRRIFQIALDRLGVRGEEAVFVGDLIKTDIVGARKLGMTTVLKQPWGTTRRHHLADHIIRQVSDLPGVLQRIQEPPRPIERLPVPAI